MITTLSFESELASSPETVWAWITSFDGISKEMAPLLRMSTPRGVKDLTSVFVEPGTPLFRSRVSLFTLVPIDYSDLTLLALTPGVGFLEQSRMGSMKLWRHERQLVPLAAGCRITDTLTFEPKFGGRLIVAFVKRFFTHRHNRLRKYLGEYAAQQSQQIRRH